MVTPKRFQRGKGPVGGISKHFVRCASAQFWGLGEWINVGPDFLARFA